MPKISELTETTVPAGAMQIPINDAGTTKRITLASIQDDVEITGGNIDGTIIGATTPAAGLFSAVTSVATPFPRWNLNTDASTTVCNMLSSISGSTATSQLNNLYSGTLFGIFVITGRIVSLGGQTGITASTTQTQGQQPLVASFNVVATVGNANDVVTLPSAAAGNVVCVMNNGANTLQVFPASGDAIGTGSVDASTTQTTKTMKMYIAADATTWMVA